MFGMPQIIFLCCLSIVFATVTVGETTVNRLIDQVVRDEKVVINKQVVREEKLDISARRSLAATATFVKSGLNSDCPTGYGLIHNKQECFAAYTALKLMNGWSGRMSEGTWSWVMQCGVHISGSRGAFNGNTGVHFKTDGVDGYSPTEDWVHICKYVGNNGRNPTKSPTPLPTRGTPILLTANALPVTSSATYGYPHLGLVWPAHNALRSLNNAILGHECRWHNPGSVAIRAGTNLFWQVDLGDVHVVTQIRLRGFNMGGYSNDVQFSVCQDQGATDCSNCGSLVTTPPGGWVENNCSIRGRYVRLFNSNSGGGNWHFCRVSVYGYLG